MTARIQAALQAKDLLPRDHRVDKGYVDAALLVTSQQDYQINLVGPTLRDTGWQACQPGQGFTFKDFKVDWDRRSR